MEYNQYFTYGEDNVFEALSWILICIAFICNIPVFTSACDPEFRGKSRNKYIISMSVANVMVLIDLAIIPLYKVPSPPAVQSITGSITQMYEFVTELLIVIVLLDQYRVASQPAVVNAETDNTRMIRRLATIWASSIFMLMVICALQFFLFIGKASYLIGLVLLMPYTLALGVSLFLVVIIIRVSNSRDAELEGEDHIRRSARIRRITQALTVISVMFFLLLLPGKIYIWYWSGTHDPKYLRAFNFVVAITLILASMLAPVVLFAMTSEYRNSFFRCCLTGDSYRGVTSSSKTVELNAVPENEKLNDNTEAEAQLQQ